jgi:hypothetical protein
MAVSSLIAPSTGSFLDWQQSQMLPDVSIWIVWVAVILEQRQGKLVVSIWDYSLIM